jgi:hypothetical protein
VKGFGEPFKVLVRKLIWWLCHVEKGRKDRPKDWFTHSEHLSLTEMFKALKMPEFIKILGK